MAVARCRMGLIGSLLAAGGAALALVPASGAAAAPVATFGLSDNISFQGNLIPTTPGHALLLVGPDSCILNSQDDSVGQSCVVTGRVTATSSASGPTIYSGSFIAVGIPSARNSDPEVFRSTFTTANVVNRICAFDGTGTETDETGLTPVGLFFHKVGNSGGRIVVNADIYDNPQLVPAGFLEKFCV